MNKDEVEDRMVLEVTLVMLKLKLNVSWAANQRGATCNRQHAMHCHRLARSVPTDACKGRNVRHHGGCLQDSPVNVLKLRRRRSVAHRRHELQGLCLMLSALSACSFPILRPECASTSVGPHSSAFSFSAKRLFLS